MLPALSVPAAIARFAFPAQFGAPPVHGRAAVILPLAREKVLFAYFFAIASLPGGAALLLICY